MTVPPNWMTSLTSFCEKSPDDRPFNARQVQAAMLRLEETSAGKDGQLELNPMLPMTSRLAGAQLLRKQIQLRIDRTPPGEVGWRRLGRDGAGDRGGDRRGIIFRLVMAAIPLT